MSASLSIHGATIVLPHRLVHSPLHVRDGLVSFEPAEGAHELDLSDHLVFPGLVNAHDHLQLNAIPRPALGGHFPNSEAWVEAFRLHFDDHAIKDALAVDPEARHWQGGLKNLLSGATTVAHHDPWHPVLDDPDFPVRLLRAFGWCHSLGRAGSYGPSLADSFAATPHARPWLVHAAEGTDAAAADEVEQLDAAGLLQAHTVLIHGVGIDEAGLNRLLARGAAVVWCPSSNLHILGKTLRPRRLYDCGRLALGTDSRISGSNDLLEELRAARDHSDLKPNELLELATAAGGRVLRMPEVGGLAPGQQADFVVAAEVGAEPYETILGLRRGQLRAVVRGGLPFLADPDLGSWFEAFGIQTARVVLDGRPKLCAASLLARPVAAAMEPGLQVLNERRGQT